MEFFKPSLKQKYTAKKISKDLISKKESEFDKELDFYKKSKNDLPAKAKSNLLERLRKRAEEIKKDKKILTSKK